MTDADDPVQIVMRGFAAWAAGDMDGAMALVAEDAEWNHAESLPYGGTYHGVREIREAIPRWMLAFSAVRFEPEEVHVTGDTAWVIGTMEATPRDGAPLRTWFVHAYTVREGRMARLREWTDMGPLLARHEPTAD